MYLVLMRPSTFLLYIDCISSDDMYGVTEKGPTDDGLLPNLKQFPMYC